MFLNLVCHDDSHAGDDTVTCGKATDVICGDECKATWDALKTGNLTSIQSLATDFGGMGCDFSALPLALHAYALQSAYV